MIREMSLRNALLQRSDNDWLDGLLAEKSEYEGSLRMVVGMSAWMYDIANSPFAMRTLAASEAGSREVSASATAMRVYGLKPVSRVQISPSPPHTQVKRRVTVKGNSPFLRSERGKFGAARGGVHTAIHTFARSMGKTSNSLLNEKKATLIRVTPRKYG